MVSRIRTLWSNGNVRGCFCRTIKIDYREIAGNGNNGFATAIRRRFFVMSRGTREKFDGGRTDFFLRPNKEFDFIFRTGAKKRSEGSAFTSADSGCGRSSGSIIPLSSSQSASSEIPSPDPSFLFFFFEDIWTREKSSEEMFEEPQAGRRNSSRRKRSSQSCLKLPSDGEACHRWLQRRGPMLPTVNFT